MNLPLIAYAVIITIAWFWTIAILVGKLNEISTLRGILVDRDRRNSQTEAANAKLHELLNEELAHSEHLRIQLQSASKNDNRDPTTGRFVKGG